MRHLKYYYLQLHNYAGKVLYVNLVGMMLISLFDGLAMVLIIPIISASGIFALDLQSIPFLQYLDLNQVLPKEVGLPILLGIYVILVVGQLLLQNKLNTQKTILQTGFMNRLRLNIYDSLLKAKWEFHLKNRKSDFVNALTHELGRVSTGTNGLLSLIIAIIYAIVQLSIALLLSVQITLFVLICGIILSLFTRKIIKRSHRIGENTSAISKSYYAGITDHFNGMKEIKSNTLEPSMHAWLDQINQRMMHEKLANVKLRNESQLYYKTASAIFIAIFAYFSIKFFHSTPEQLLIVIFIFSNIWPKLQSIQKTLENIASTLPACESLFHLQTQCSKETENYWAGDKLQKGTKIQLKKEIACNHVWFRYSDEQAYFALRNITIMIPSKCTTAIVGRSGAGKSTLVDLLMGLLEPERGQVCIDGIPITKYHLSDLREMIGYVPQDPYLFNGSIWDNLVIVDPHVNEEQIWEALNFASADQFVRMLPQGIHTIIGDRGVRLSGGERQRIVLARAILRQPSILVLDEATSALDTENEAKIHEALDRLKGTMTVIVIAHRLSTIEKADHIIVLDKGEVFQVRSDAKLEADQIAY